MRGLLLTEEVGMYGERTRCESTEKLKEIDQRK